MGEDEWISFVRWRWDRKGDRLLDDIGAMVLAAGDGWRKRGPRHGFTPQVKAQLDGLWMELSEIMEDPEGDYVGGRVVSTIERFWKSAELGGKAQSYLWGFQAEIAHYEGHGLYSRFMRRRQLFAIREFAERGQSGRLRTACSVLFCYLRIAMFTCGILPELIRWRWESRGSQG
jgi:hypothetical protein